MTSGCLCGAEALREKSGPQWTQYLLPRKRSQARGDACSAPHTGQYFLYSAGSQSLFSPESNFISRMTDQERGVLNPRGELPIEGEWTEQPSSPGPGVPGARRQPAVRFRSGRGTAGRGRKAVDWRQGSAPLACVHLCPCWGPGLALWRWAQPASVSSSGEVSAWQFCASHVSAFPLGPLRLSLKAHVC